MSEATQVETKVSISDAPPSYIRSGMARIKPEYIVDVKAIKTEEKPPETVINENEQKNEDAPPPKKKRRGQNKKRPLTARAKFEECLCPSLVNEKGKCAFGEKCRFIHDIAKYMSIKPPDISDECYMFKNHGKCFRGVTCRYGSTHIKKTEEGSYVNIINEEIVESNPVSEMINTIPREVTLSLRKKKYQFPKSDVVNKKLLEKNESKSNGNTEVIETNPKTDIIKETESDTVIPTLGNGMEKTENSLSTTSGVTTNADVIALQNSEKKVMDFKGKLFLAPLTTVGNLPFRTTCKSLGADITCGEMAMATCLLQGNVSEWALLKRHPSEDFFGVQICGAFPDTMTKCAELIENECQVDFVDINMGCPIDLVYQKGGGSALMRRTNKLYDIVKSMNSVMTVPLTCKMRTGIDSKHSTAHNILPKLRDFGVALSTVHGRSRQARYTKLADWNYIEECAKASSPMPFFGNGDILSYEDYNSAMEHEHVAGIMIARGALIKPWIFTEIKEQRHWDISSSERFDILKKYTNIGLMHWGSDTRGVETTRKFLLEWLSFLHRYIPVALLEQAPQKINEQPPKYIGRNDLETLMASHNCKAWVEISEMLLGKVPDEFQFLPKHKANSYN